MVVWGCPGRRTPVPAPGAAPPHPPCLVSGPGARCPHGAGNPDPAGLRDGRRGGSAAPGFGGPVPGLPSRDLGAGELGGALAGCGEPAAPWHRGGAGDAVSVQRVCECAGACGPCARSVRSPVRCGHSGARRPGAPLRGAAVRKLGRVGAHARSAAAGGPQAWRLIEKYFFPGPAAPPAACPRRVPGATVAAR